MVQSISIKIDVQPLLRALQQLPEKCRVRVLVPAANKAARRIASAVRKLVPVQKKMRKPHTHYRDAVTQVVRDYPRTESIVAVIGAESGVSPHAHFVEDGTNQRWTNMRSRYRRMSIRARAIIKGGRVRFVTEQERKSIGSFLRKNKKPSFNRGRMPAFHSVAKGVKAAESAVAMELKTSIETGIKRELVEDQIARGK